MIVDDENKSPNEYGGGTQLNRDKIFAALAKAQAAFKKIEKTQTNPFYKSKYADLSDVYKAIQQALSENEIAHFQTMDADSGVLTTTLGHSSGQTIVSTINLPSLESNKGPQVVGSELTYYRRYAVCAITGCVGDGDDDGNGAQGNATTPPAAPRSPDRRIDKNKARVSVGQVKRMFTIATKREWTTENVKTLMHLKFKLKSSKELSVAQYEQLIDIIEKKTPAQEFADEAGPPTEEPKKELVNHAPRTAMPPKIDPDEKIETETINEETGEIS